jgi:3,4-dihydroxy 2-butanone 4-phosphate synthase / GTP cyclohydrolase II
MFGRIQMSFAPISEALERVAAGHMVVVVDGPERENEGDLTMAAEFVTAETVNFMICEARGLVCAPSDLTMLDRLKIGPMVDPDCATCDTAFAVSVDHISNTTGIAAHERADTIRALADEHSLPWDFRRPGHVFPLRAKPGGVLERAGHTEAAVDLCRLAGLVPAGAICEVLGEDGSPARLPDLERFAARHGLAIVSVDELIGYREQADVATVRASL